MSSRSKREPAQPHTAKTQGFADLNAQETASTAVLIVTLGAIEYEHISTLLGAITVLVGLFYHIFFVIWFAYVAFSDDANAAVRNRRVYYTGLLILFCLIALSYIGA